MKRIYLTDTNGMTWMSDPDVDGELERHRSGLIDLLTDWPNLTHLAIEMGGVKRYFNPANLVCAWIGDVEETHR